MLTINNTLDGYLKDVEIKGNTIQDAENLADIRSVGDKVEGQELYEIPVLSLSSCLETFNKWESGIINENGTLVAHGSWSRSDFIPYPSNQTFTIQGSSIHACYYDKNKTFISRDTNSTFTVPNTCRYIRFNCPNSNIDTIKIKPISDKLTILSPVQLEKVGDVADRIVCKDGVWGVEKNIVEDYLINTGSWSNIINVDGFVTTYRNNQFANGVVICDRLKTLTTSEWQSKNIKGIYTLSSNMGLCIPSNEITELNSDGINKWIVENKPLVKYPTTQPQFIPLPHDQQIKLRTFANKTNISFGCEIEGTIKAQVPKSLGATVNTHTEQINNLNKELDRVKKLEESTVSTVTTESDFTTVEATSNGYFEDVKLEGKTLVNLANNSNNIPNPNINHNVIYPMILDVKNKNYTLVIKLNTSKQLNCKYAYTDGTLGNDFKFCDANVNGVVTKLITPNMLPIDFDKEVNGFRLSVVGGTPLDVTIDYIEFLEGDHTQNPPSYFEGLKSVGDTTDEIVVSSYDNARQVLYREYNFAYYDANFNIISTTYNNVFGELIKVKPNTNYTIQYDESSDFNPRIYGYTSIPKCPINTAHQQKVVELDQQIKNYSISFTTNDNINYLFIGRYRGEIFNANYIIKSDYEHIVRKQDKKRLLYYNNETQAWEKPILRQWDSIEKHADGKYYYHQRSGEVVLNGNENWISWTLLENTTGFILTNTSFNNISDKEAKTAISDKFTSASINDFKGDVEGVGLWVNENKLIIRINNSKLPTQDVQGFKQWLQANNVTVVYQLAQEKVYECTNIDLITYANETNYIVESGVLSPRTTLKVHNNISNVVSLLQKKVSLLESNITSYMITQNRLQLASTYSADSVTFKVDYFAEKSVNSYDDDLFNLILNNIIVGKENYDYDKMFNIIMDYASWSQISWDQFDILVGMMDLQHNPPIEVPSETPEA